MKVYRKPFYYSGTFVFFYGALWLGLPLWLSALAGVFGCWLALAGYDITVDV